MKTLTMKSTKLLSLALVMAMLLVLAVPALASPELVYTTVALNARSGPGTNYPIVGELRKGQEVPRVGTSGNWSIVELGNTRVYVYSSYLKLAGSGGTGGTSGSTRYTTGRVNVRSGPGTGYKVISTLSKGDAVTTMGTVGSWTIIKWNDGTAYLFTKYLTGSGSGSGSGSITPSSGTVQATTNVNVRSGPGTNFSKVGWLTKGEILERTGITGDWTQVVYSGKTAYVHSSYLRVVGSEPGVSPASGIVEATANVNVRTGPGTTYSLAGSLRTGDRLTRTGISGNWTRVEYQGRTAWVSSGYLRVVTGGGVTGENMYLTESTTMYSGPGSNYSRLTTVPGGAMVRYYERSGSWGQIYYNGYTGYVPMNLLVENPSSSVSGLAYAPTGATVYASAGGSSVMGTLPRGEAAVAVRTSGSWLEIMYYGRTGYVRGTDVVILTSNSQTSFSDSEKTMYSKANNLAVYTIPSDSSAYYYGWMPLNEEVRRLAYNSTWTKIYADGRILYTRTENLKDSISGGSDLPANGTVMEVTNGSGALMYSDSSLRTPFVVTDSRNGLVLADRIPSGATVTFRGAVGNAYQVEWSRFAVTVYVKASDLRVLAMPFGS